MADVYRIHIPRAWHVYTTIYYYIIVYEKAPRRIHSSVRRGAATLPDRSSVLITMTFFFPIVRAYIILHINTYLHWQHDVCNAITTTAVPWALGFLIEFFFFFLLEYSIGAHNTTYVYNAICYIVPIIGVCEPNFPCPSSTVIVARIYYTRR